MEHLVKEKERKKGVHWTGKKPYAKPTLTVHGDVEDITEVLRLTCAKGRITAATGDTFIKQ
jgi:hypothetical protein